MPPENLTPPAGEQQPEPSMRQRLGYREFAALAHKGSDETYYFDKYLFRGISIAGSYVLSFTRIPPNVVTFISLLCSIAAVWFFLHPTTTSLLIGCGLVFLYHYLDHVDGELARVYMETRDYRPGIAGAYFDVLCHSFTMNLWLPALAFGLYQQTDQPLVMIVGIAAIPAMSNFTQYVGAYMFTARLHDEPELVATERGQAALHVLTGRHRQVAAVQAGAASSRGLLKVVKEIIGYPGMIYLVIVCVIWDAIAGTIWARLGVLVILTGFHAANNVRRLILISRRFAAIT